MSTHPLRRTMRPVIQAEVTGCGIASVAAIAGVSYARAKKISNSFGIFAQDKNLWSETTHVRRLLNHYGFRVKTGELPFRSWHSLPNLALLAIKWHVERNKPFWHWVVFIRDGSGARVLDSRKNLRRHRRTDFGRMKPKWYIEVRPKSL
jgi:ABC-type bacteriocin/lantibiotic exporter with double-glycine peptidase domain